MPRHAARTAAHLLTRKLTYVHAGVTHRCNLRCTMCRIWTRAGDLPEAPPERWREVARLLAAKGATTVSLGGGEPFCRPDLPQIVAAFAENGFRVRVLTNGVMINQTALEKCLAAGLSDLSFSLDSTDVALQEKLDGMPGGLDNRLRNLAMLTEVMPREKSVLINTVITAANLAMLSVLSDLAYRLGFMISYIPVHLDPAGEHDFFGADQSLKPSAELAPRIKDTIRNLLQDKKRRGHIANSRAFLAAIPEFLQSGKSAWACHAGSLYLSLRPDAKASVCHDYETADAVEVEQIDAHWTEEYLKHARQNCLRCLRPCWTEVSLLATEPSAMWDQARLQLHQRLSQRHKMSFEQIRRLLESPA